MSGGASARSGGGGGLNERSICAGQRGMLHTLFFSCVMVMPHETVMRDAPRGVPAPPRGAPPGPAPAPRRAPRPLAGPFHRARGDVAASLSPCPCRLSRRWPARFPPPFLTRIVYRTPLYITIIWIFYYNFWGSCLVLVALVYDVRAHKLVVNKITQRKPTLLSCEQRLVHLQQNVRIERCVHELLLLQRAARPVAALLRLVEPQADGARAHAA